MDKKLPREAYRVLEKARHAIERYDMLREGDKVLVAVSGGPDSLVLLDVLSRLSGPFGLSLEVFHVDHALRPESASEAVYVGRVAEAYGLPFACERVNVERESPGGRLSPEEAAREARYTALEKRRRDGGFDHVALGHQADDRVETLLLRLIIGAGPRALASIPPVRGPYVRPLTFVWTSEIEGYAACLPMPPLRDPSNQDQAIPRNRVRHGLLPYLEDGFNPAVRENLARILDMLEEERSAGMSDQPAAAPCEAGSIGLEAYGDLPVAGRRLLLREHLISLGLRPSFNLIEDLRANVCEGRSGNAMDLPGGWKAVREYSSVVFLPCLESFPEDVPEAGKVMEIPGEGEYAFPATGDCLRVTFAEAEAPGGSHLTNGPWEASLDLDRLLFPLELRLIEPGDRFKPLGAPGHRKVQDFLTDAKVPRRERQRTLALLSAGRIAWLVGQRIDDDFKVTPETVRVAHLSIGYNI